MSTASGVVAFGWAILATCGLSVARADILVANNNSARIAAVKMFFVIRKVMYIFHSFSVLDRTKKTAPVRVGPVGNSGERKQGSGRRSIVVCQEEPPDWSLVQNEDTVTE